VRHQKATVELGNEIRHTVCALGKVVKRRKAFGNGLALRVEHDQALLMRDAANARDA
jgi:hypothetical protein